VGELRSMSRRMSRPKQKGKAVYINPRYYKMLTLMAKGAGVSIDKVVEDVLLMGMETIAQQERGRTDLIKVVPGMGSVRDQLKEGEREQDTKAS